MFTGLIEEVGSVLSLSRSDTGTQRIVVASKYLSRKLHTGESIAVSGVCLTALDIKPGKSFAADLAKETIERTSLAQLGEGSIVNLELPLRSGAPLGGHIVQGHVEGVGHITALEPVGPERDAGDWRLEVEVPAELTRYIVHKGSITIEGISLTVAAIVGNRLTVAIIPHTYAATNLHALRVGAPVNIETDVLAKYAEKTHATDQPGTVTIKKLFSAGF